MTDAPGSRDKVYMMVQRSAIEAYKGKKGFEIPIKDNRGITTILDEKEIEDCFELNYYLTNVGKIFKRVFCR